MNFPKILVPAAMLASAVPAAYSSFTYEAGSYWAAGVSAKSGWYDVNKDGNGDSELCWAASAANIIAWWQDRVGAENLPSGAPTTAADIFSTFKKTFKNMGYSTSNGWGWYFGGFPLAEAAYDKNFQDSTTSRSSGRYYEDYVKECGLASEVNLSMPKYVIYTSISESYGYQGLAQNLVSGICNDLKSGCGVSLSIFGGNGHQLTLWGVEIDEKENVLLYLTDSDSGKSEPTLFCAGLDFKTTTEYEDLKDGNDPVAWEKTEVFLTGYGNNNWKITHWETLMLPYPAIPEPSAFGLLAGTLALALTASRRRRNKR